ncbi:MAG: hypothetical protein HYZ65_06815 [Burkholderiales bacterium]|nr:hypothetical protein [Burkholderiales bacterium]
MEPKSMMPARMLVFLFALICFGAKAETNSALIETNFKVKTADGKGELNVVVNWPDLKNEKFPVVIVIPGTENTSDAYFNPVAPDFGQDIDGLMGLGRKLIERGVVVVRYDSRGTIAGRRCMKGEKKLTLKAFAVQCQDQDLKRTIDFKTWRDDIVSVYEAVAKLNHIDLNRVAILSISEGTAHAANVVGNGRIKAKLFASMGGVIESIRETSTKQDTTPKLFALLQSKFTNEKKTIKLSEILKIAEDNYYPKLSDYAQEFGPEPELGLDQLIVKHEVYAKGRTEMIEILRTQPRAAFLSTRTQPSVAGSSLIMNFPDAPPFNAEEFRAARHTTIVRASVGYFQDIFFEKVGAVQALSDLQNFSGDMLFYFGENDRLVDVPAAVALINDAQKSNKGIFYRVFGDVGHDLVDSHTKRIPGEILTTIADEIASRLRP